MGEIALALHIIQKAAHAFEIGGSVVFQKVRAPPYQQAIRLDLAFAIPNGNTRRNQRSGGSVQLLTAGVDFFRNDLFGILQRAAHQHGVEEVRRLSHRRWRHADRG